MTSIRSEWICDADELERLRSPRDDVLVLESAPKSPADAGYDSGGAGRDSGGAGRDSGGANFDCASGPFRTYRRSLRWTPAPEAAGSEAGGAEADGSEAGGSGRRFRVEQSIDYSLAVPYWAWLFWYPVKRTLGEGPRPGRSLWWSTPDRLDSRQSRLVAAIALLNLVGGVLYGLITQVLTFVAADLGDGSRSEQTSLLATVRVGVVVTVVVMVAADRIGRRKVAIGAFATSGLLTLVAALSPNLWTLGALQFVSRNLAIAGLLCADTIAVEEMPPGSRAMVASLGTLAYGLGAGMVVMTLPLADIGSAGWRLTFLLAGLSLPIVWHVRRHLPESRRYVLLEAERAVKSPGPTEPDGAVRARSTKSVSVSRFVLVGAIFLLLNVFLAPASQLQNDYLRTEVGFSGTLISVFVLLTSTPGGIGVLVGGKVADLYGRRWAIIPGLTALGVFYAVFFSSSNWVMWVASLVASVIGGMAAPALGVIAPELFPTARRGTVRGVITGLAVAGSVIGLVISGWLIDSRGYSFAFSALAVAAVAAAALALALPETRGRELEDINH